MLRFARPKALALLLTCTGLGVGHRAGGRWLLHAIVKVSFLRVTIKLSFSRALIALDGQDGWYCLLACFLVFPVHIYLDDENEE